MRERLLGVLSDEALESFAPRRSNQQVVFAIFASFRDFRVRQFFHPSNPYRGGLEGGGSAGTPAPSCSSAQPTASPTVMTPSSSTCAKTPPPQFGRIAARRPGNASSMRSHGVVSPPIAKRTEPI